MEQLIIGNDHNNEVIDSTITYRASVTWESRECLGLCTVTLCSLFESIETFQGAALITQKE